MGKCRNGSKCRFAHGEQDCNPLLNAVKPRERVVEDRAVKNNKEKKQQQPHQQQQKGKDMAEPMFIKPNAIKVQASSEYLSHPQVMGYPMGDTAQSLPPPGLAGVWNMEYMLQQQALYDAAYYNAQAVATPMVPESTAELSCLFDHIKILTEQVKNLQDSMNQNMRSDSDCSTYSGANDETPTSETSSNDGQTCDNVWSNGPMGNMITIDNKLA